MPALLVLAAYSLAILVAGAIADIAVLVAATVAVPVALAMVASVVTIVIPVAVSIPVASVIIVIAVGALVAFAIALAVALLVLTLWAHVVRVAISVIDATISTAMTTITAAGILPSLVAADKTLMMRISASLLSAVSVVIVAIVVAVLSERKSAQREENCRAKNDCLDSFH